MRLVNAYGPTECSVVAFMHEVTLEDVDHGRMPLGRPVYQTDTYILDKEMKQVTGTGTGELFLGGPGLSPGYLFDDDKTSKAFVSIKDPQGSSKVIRLYRTNDMIEIHPEGYLTWAGRMNREIKLSGHRVRLDLVETELMQTKLIDNVAAMKYSCPTLNTDYLVACIVYKDNQEAHDKLVEEAKKRLPEYMVPRLIKFDELPINSNGKIDHGKALERLKDMMQARHFRIAAADAPDFQELNQTEKRLKQIWAEILISVPTEVVNKTSNFFHLGGNSSDVATLLGRIHESLDMFLPVRAIFQNPVLEDQARAIDQGDYNSTSVEEIKAAMENDAEKYSNAISIPESGNVLLTGGTGFVAPFLIQELLQVPDIKAIYCLVRADSPKRGIKRLSSTFEKYGLRFDTSKIKVVLGDFSQPKLGLIKTTYNKLASSISAVYHLGALVNYNQPYSSHQAANVVGTFHMLEFASARRPKAFHYISSLAAFGPTGLVEKNSNLAEDDSLEPHLEHSLPYEGGYGQSQWVADEMVARVMRRGFPAAIYRLGFVLCHSSSGIGNPNDFMGRLLSDCAKLGVCPILPDQRKELISVDNVARTIKAISATEGNLGHVYHITSGLRKPIDMDSTFQLLNKLCGVEVKALPYTEWIEHLRKANKEGKSLRLRSLFPVLEEKVYDGKTRWQVYEGMANFRVDNTLRALRDAGESEDILAPVSNAALEKYFVNCLQIKDSTVE
ncbi:ubiquitin ligase subunit [Trichoderma cornu-damae]|uniref:Ubiquitin ligase subunit n=1 Tax=Trichoderma cornu-damae TaxID=654480 RepID=A0A9P8QZJ9_9HYPO|nr:ubiquitin ligase subunit [Trichoderma cornu-damae]